MTAVSWLLITLSLLTPPSAARPAPALRGATVQMALRSMAAPALHKRVQRLRMRKLVAQLPPGWISGLDEASGQVYYYNEQQGVSQWEAPQADIIQPGYDARAILQVQGVSGVKGFTFQEGSAHLDRYRELPYTVHTGDELVLSRWNMVQQRIHVSREQCKVQVAADGTATLFSCGRPPTLWRSRTGASWEALLKGDTHDLSEGDMISLDAQDPNAAVFVVQASQQGDSADYEQLPIGWLKDVDAATGSPYYINQQTGQSQWEFPQ